MEERERTWLAGLPVFMRMVCIFISALEGARLMARALELRSSRVATATTHAATYIVNDIPRVHY